MLRIAIALILGLSVLAPGTSTMAEQLTLYSARAQSLVDPLIRSFEEKAGIQVRVRYGANAELVGQIMEEGPRSPADLFWGYENSLAVLAQAGFLERLPEEILDRARPVYRPGDGMWVPTSIRARTLAYSPERVSEHELPTTVVDLVEPLWQGRVGWAPTNAGFQTFVTGLRLLIGEEEALAWLEAMQANRTQSYRNNTALIQALAAGEIDLALVNHYYLCRFLVADPEFPVAQTLLGPGDPGNLLLAAGMGLLRSASAPGPALRLLAYLLSAEGQAFFTEETHEFPATADTPAALTVAELAEDADRLVPSVDLGDLSDLGGTLSLLRRAGVI